MRIWSSAGVKHPQSVFASVAIATIAALTACSSGSSQYAPSGSAGIISTAGVIPSMLIPVRSGRVIPHPDHSRSWMAKGAASTALLYLSDYGTGDVYVYSWPSLALMGTLTGFTNPAGICVDKTQNIWIVNYGAEDVVQYAHGGTSQIGSVSNNGYFPVGCAINKRTGALAVSDIGSAGSGSGGITIYQKGRGTGKTYTDSSIPFVHFVGYDRSDNLFLDGQNPSGVFQLAKFKRGTFTSITVSGGTINSPGGVQYVGGLLTVDDQVSSIIYQMSEAGVISGSTPMADQEDCPQPFIRRKSVVCPNASGLDYLVYAYPAGGAPRKTITGSFSSPFGSAISL